MVGLVLALSLAACTGGASSTPPAGQPELWRTAELRDVRSGEILTISELGGSLVVIETMAIWCVTCRLQQNEAAAALASLDSDEIVYISLDIDPNENEADLARYAEDTGFDWHFVVASREVARSLADTFGEQVLSPPATPVVVVTPAGEVTVRFGIQRADALVAEFSSHLP